MSSGENDILFRIGFESHPQAGAKMEALAKSVEALQVRMDQSMRRVGDRAIVEAGRVNAATGGGGGAGGGGGGGGGGASGAMGASSRKAQYDKEIEEDRHYRAAMARGGVAAHMTLKQQNEAVRIAGEARLTVQRQQADQAVILMEQLQRDIELVQRARGGNPDDASLDEVMAANERVQASHRVFEEGREREAAAEEKARKEQARAAEKANREAIKQQ